MINNKYIIQTMQEDEDDDWVIHEKEHLTNNIVPEYYDSVDDAVEAIKEMCDYNPNKWNSQGYSDIVGSGFQARILRLGEIWEVVTP